MAIGKWFGKEEVLHYVEISLTLIMLHKWDLKMCNVYLARYSCELIKVEISLFFLPVDDDILQEPI